MSRRTRGQTHAMQDSFHSMGLVSISDHSWLATNPANREVFDETIRENGLLRTQINLPTAPASDLSALPTVNEAEASEYAGIWRRSEVGEFNGLLQAYTFGPE